MKNLKKEIWSLEDYKEFIGYLKNLEDKKYKDFESKLITTKYEIIGIKIPLLRKIAFNISKGDINSFLSNTQNIYFEEVMIKAFVIASIKNKKPFLKNLDEFVYLIDNWSICDSFCNSLKIVKEDKEFYFNYFSKYLKSNSEFVIRTSLVVFLNFYVEEEYIDRILKLVDNINTEFYYVNMAISWLLCECFIKYRDKTLKYLLKNNLNSFTFNKTISKINDSYRVSDEDKKFLKKIKEEIHEKN
jgi:3-methyladenine DNA glycosylase AlkD